ncbi:MAG: DinB family protein [Bacteroidota bacterium]
MKLTDIMGVNVSIESIILQLKNIQEGKNWMGANFDKKLVSISEEEAFVRPIPNLHSVAEIISHLTVWRKETILKIETGTGKLTDDSEENWLPNYKLKEIGWDKIKSEYRNSLLQMIKLLQTKDDSFLNEHYYDTDFKGDYPYRFVIHGMLHHDIYHLGQLGIIIKFLKEPKS